MHRRLILAAALCLAACHGADPAQGGLATGPNAAFVDYNAFVCDVMPILVRRCSYLACHGDAAHALRVYSPGKLRAGDPTTRDARDAKLTQAEIDANFESAAAFARAAANPDESLLLRKPLSARFGGAEHHGIGVFPTHPHAEPADDPEWLLLANWVNGGRQPTPPEARCRDFFQALEATPR